MNLLLKLVKNFKTANMKARLASIVGLLIRHATVIENELSQLGIPAVLIELIKNEKNEKVKRRAIAALGEYLFYGATQIDEDPQNVVWDLNANCYQILVKVIKTTNEDEIVRFFAAKTVENITA
jgi:serine/threonine-protein kinase ULK4